MARIFSLSIPDVFEPEWRRILEHATKHNVSVGYVIRRCLIASKTNPQSPLYEGGEETP